MFFSLNMIFKLFSPLQNIVQHVKRAACRKNESLQCSSISIDCCMDMCDRPRRQVWLCDITVLVSLLLSLVNVTRLQKFGGKSTRTQPLCERHRVIWAYPLQCYSIIHLPPSYLTCFPLCACQSCRQIPGHVLQTCAHLTEIQEPNTGPGKITWRMISNGTHMKNSY